MSVLKDKAEVQPSYKYWYTDLEKLSNYPEWFDDTVLLGQTEIFWQQL